MSQLDPVWVAIFPGLDHNHKIQTQQHQIVQVVLSKRFPSKVCVHETKAAETCCPAAEPPNVREFEMRGISQDHISNNTVAGQQDADLPSQFPGESAKVPCKFRRNSLLRQDAPPKRPLQGATLGLLYSQDVSVYMLNRVCSLQSCVCRW